MKVIKLVEKAFTWVSAIDFSTPMPASIQVVQHIEILSKVKTIPLLSTKVRKNAKCQTEILDLVCKTQLSDDTINVVMARLFGSRNDVIVMKPNIIGNISNGEISITVAIFADVFAGMKTEKICIPVCCNKIHWCGIMVNTRLKDACIYDPMSSNYAVAVRALVEKLVTQLPEYAPRKYRVHHN
ncbi:LOW QUALITY PROTEIN: Hypothetical protein PHPALM_11515 [Phytophthora palmivora]|uniref:Ubiquitin-like protease family profile domain-containing protein n=1 Tax=Phytophthora palmivora TaxID=4796 RepID=A0A2P4Y234_9STRA|nr:LOW QUALITY PROTEIN: Hypothetical protein PHPALM_11515 [Phytophthora palmivora]